MNKPSWALRLFYAMLTDPKFSFEYFNSDQRSSIKKGAKRWRIMMPQLDYMMGPLLSNEIVIASGRSVGKCGKDTDTIMNEDGTYIELKNLINTSFKVQSFNENINELFWADAFAEDNGNKECFELQLDGNFKTSVTSEHPFLTMDGWKSIIDLNIGDYIVQPEYVPEPLVIDDTPSDNELKLIGYMLGDGCISNTCDFTNINPNVINEMRNIVKEFNCTLKKKSRYYNKRGNYRISTKRTDICNRARVHEIKNLLRELKIYNTTSHTKFIPDKYLKCSNKKLAILINRLFTCDGWYSKDRIGYCTVSEKMMKQVQLILLRFGIRATYVEKKVKYNNGINIAYQLNISSNKIREFYEKIGIFTKLNDENTIHLKDLSDRKKLIPFNTKLYDELNSKRIFTYDELEKNQCRLRTQYNTVDVDKLRRYLNINKIDEVQYEYLWKNIVWCKIKSIKSIGNHSTVAITVPETHTHIIDGILSHNTSSVEHMLFMYSLTTPKKWSAYIVKNARHANVLIQHLTDYFNKDSFTREMFVGYDKKDRIFTMRNGHKIEIRISGFDKTGATTMVSGHYDFIFIDEAQILPKKLLEELLPALKEGGKLIVTGVPNNLRDSILWYFVNRKEAMYYRYASYESADWDEDKEKRAIDMYGGKNTEQWNNLVAGCLPPGELIFTKRGMIPIEQVIIGDEVLTHKNRFRPVIKTFKLDYNGPMHVIKTTYDDNLLYITPEHPISSKIVKRKTIYTDKKTTIKEVSDLDFREPMFLKKGDKIQFPNIEYNGTINDIEFMYALGLYFAEGSISDKYHVQYSLHKKEMNLVDKLNKYFHNTPYIYNSKYDKSMRVTYGNKDEVTKFNNFIFGKSINKTFNWDILNYDNDSIISFLNGIFDGDG